MHPLTEQLLTALAPALEAGPLTREAVAKWGETHLVRLAKLAQNALQPPFTLAELHSLIWDIQCVSGDLGPAFCEVTAATLVVVVRAVSGEGGPPAWVAPLLEEPHLSAIVAGVAGWTPGSANP